MSYFDNVLVVEDINKKREPLQTMEGVYLITPSEDSVRGLIRDFESPTRPLYKGAHVFFTEGNNYNYFLRRVAFVNGTNLSHDNTQHDVISSDDHNYFPADRLICNLCITL